jgi:hypothetical protein
MRVTWVFVHIWDPLGRGMFGGRAKVVEVLVFVCKLYTKDKKTSTLLVPMPLFGVLSDRPVDQRNPLLLPHHGWSNRQDWKYARMGEGAQRMGALKVHTIKGAALSFNSLARPKLYN